MLSTLLLLPIHLGNRVLGVTMELALFLAILLHRVSNLFWYAFTTVFPASTPHTSHLGSVDHRRQAVLVLGNGQGVARGIAIHLALKGYTVLLQTPETKQFGPIIAEWQEKKHASHKLLIKLRKEEASHKQAPFSLKALAFCMTRASALHRKPTDITRPGTLIPLLFQSEDSHGRKQAIATIKAYLHNNDMSLLSVINSFDVLAYRAGDQYQPTPLPLSIVRHEHLLELIELVTSPVQVLQDLMLEIATHRTRIVNLWLGDHYDESYTAVLESTFRSIATSLRKEFARMNVSVSLVQLSHSTSSMSANKLAKPISNTWDERTIITPSTPEALKQLFDGRVDKYEKKALRAAGASANEIKDLISLVAEIVEGREASLGSRFLYKHGLQAGISSLVHAFMPINLRLYIEDQLDRLLWTLHNRNVT